MSIIIRNIFGRAYWLNFLSITGALSVAALVLHGFEFGISDTFQIVLKYYERFLDIIIGWLGPLVEDVLRQIGLHIELFPHWKHVYIMTSVYFSANALNTYLSGDRATGLFEILLGLLIGILVFSGAGAVPADTPHPLPNLTIVFATMLGVFLYESIDSAWRATFYREKAARIYRENGYHTAQGVPVYFPPPWWSFFIGGVRGSSFRAILGVVIAAPLAVFLWWQGVAGWGIAILVFLVALQAANFMCMAIQDARRLVVPREKFGDAYLRSGVGKVGIRMLRFFSWIVQLLLINAGLGLLSL